MKTPSIKIRWITTTCFEVVLQNGKVILFDPWTGKSASHPEFQMDTGMEAKDFTGADYIFLSHTHFDHMDDIPAVNALFRKDSYGGRIFMPALSAYVFAQQYDVAYRDIIPMFPNETFELEDMVVTCHRCRHFGDVNDPIGRLPSKVKERSIKAGEDPENEFMHAMGSIEEVDLSITIKESNFRFLVLGGRIYRFDNIYKFCETFNPDFVIRQVSPGFTPKDYAGIIAKYKAPIVFPSHHDSHDLVKGSGMSNEEYFIKVNEELAAMGSHVQSVNIERGRWYNIGMYIDAE
jgi:Predicted Zn-dependent hydrolases of the beta-lactamase fold